MVGAVLTAFGFLIMGITWPSTEIGYSGYETEKGSVAGALIGALAAMVGQFLVMIAVVACGVRIGTRPDSGGVTTTAQ